MANRNTPDDFSSFYDDLNMSSFSSSVPQLNYRTPPSTSLINFDSFIGDTSPTPQKSSQTANSNAFDRQSQFNSSNNNNNTTNGRPLLPQPRSTPNLNNNTSNPRQTYSSNYFSSPQQVANQSTARPPSYGSSTMPTDPMNLDFLPLSPSFSTSSTQGPPLHTIPSQTQQQPTPNKPAQSLSPSQFPVQSQGLPQSQVQGRGQIPSQTYGQSQSQGQSQRLSESAPASSVPSQTSSSSAYGSYNSSSLSPEENRLSSSSNASNSEQPSIVKTVKDLFTPEEDTFKKKAAVVPSTINFAQFQVPPNQVMNLFRSWVNDRWFAPMGFVSRVSLGEIERQLVPYWLMGTTTTTTTYGKCCYVSHQPADNSGITKAVERWADGKSVHTQTYSNVMLSAFDGPLKELIQELKPFDYSLVKQSCPVGQVPSNIKVFPAADWSEKWAEYTELVIKKAEIAEGKKQLLLQTRCSRVRELKSMVTFTSLSKKLLYLPVYQGSYVYEGVKYVFIIHGLSGQVVGQRPYGLGSLGEVSKSSMDAVSDFFYDKVRALSTK